MNERVSRCYWQRTAFLLRVRRQGQLALKYKTNNNKTGKCIIYKIEK